MESVLLLLIGELGAIALKADEGANIVINYRSSEKEAQELRLP